MQVMIVIMAILKVLLCMAEDSVGLKMMTMMGVTYGAIVYSEVMSFQ